jgi:hypothetical protein
LNPEIVIDTDLDSAAENSQKIIDYLLAQGFLTRVEEQSRDVLEAAN